MEKGQICVSTEKWKNSGMYRENVESLRVSKNIPGEYRKRWNPCEYRKAVQASTEKGANLCDYRKMVESGRVPEKGKIGTSIEKLLRRVPERVKSV